MDLISSYQEVIDNVNNFKSDLLTVIDRHELFYFRYYKSFWHWYYFPYEDVFIPSKFLGYRDTRMENYVGNGHGGYTQRALTEYFEKVPHNTSQFNSLLEKLNSFSEKLGCEIGEKVKNPKGGIYIEKRRSLRTRLDPANSSLLSTCESDISSYEREENYLSFEGEVSQHLVNKYERDPKLRAEAIKIHGLVCKVCNFDFEKVYGHRGKDYIEVHHLKPLHQHHGGRIIDPKVDMTVLCANCHRMIHRESKNILAISELEAMLKYKHSYKFFSKP